MKFNEQDAVQTILASYSQATGKYPKLFDVEASFDYVRRLASEPNLTDEQLDFAVEVGGSHLEGAGRLPSPREVVALIKEVEQDVPAEHRAFVQRVLAGNTRGSGDVPSYTDIREAKELAGSLYSAEVNEQTRDFAAQQLVGMAQRQRDVPSFFSVREAIDSAKLLNLGGQFLDRNQHERALREEKEAQMKAPVVESESLPTPAAWRDERTADTPAGTTAPKGPKA